MFFYLMIINILGFCITAIDKYLAIHSKRRVKETSLLFLSFLGGSLGVLFSMYLFHHKTNKKKFTVIVPCFVLLWIFLLGSYFMMDYYHLFHEKSYQASDFGITTIQSELDHNENGIDDYTDILLGAKMEAKRNPKYKSTYYSGGYAPLEEGVCTDVVIRSLLNAGYSLKDMIDQDIKENVELYPRVEGKPDPNIDFRRVKNLKVFFDRKLEKLTNSLEEIEEWQPGDIVIFGETYTHIGIISDKRNKEGIPYLIHNAGQPKKEENTLKRWRDRKTITGHYRFSIKEEV